MPRTLFIDADACPVTRESIDCARRAGVAVVIAGNSTQNLERHIRRDDPRDAEHARRGFWVTTLDVSVGADSADFAIVERLQAGDVVVTQDIGLASMVLGRDAAAIGVRGRVYDKATIDMQLFIRHKVDFGTCPEICFFALGGVSAQNPWLNKKGASKCHASPHCAGAEHGYFEARFVRPT